MTGFGSGPSVEEPTKKEQGSRTQDSQEPNSQEPKNDIFECLKKKVSPEFYELNLASIEKDYGSWDDLTLQADAYLKPLEVLIDQGVPEETLRKLGVDNIKLYVKYGSVLGDQFFDFWKMYGFQLEKEMQYVGLKKYQRMLKDKGQKELLEFSKGLPDWFDALGNLPDNLVLGILKEVSLGACYANYSFIDDYSGRDLWSSQEMVLSTLVYRKLQESFNWSDSNSLRQIPAMAKSLNERHLLWLQIEVDGKVSIMPIYQFLKQSFSVEDGMPLAVCTGVACTDSRLMVGVRHYGVQPLVRKYQYFCTLNLDEWIKDPVEKTVAERAPRLQGLWQAPFILSDVAHGYDWSKVLEGKYYPAISFYVGSESYVDATIRCLQIVNKGFPNGTYNTLVFKDGIELSIFKVFDGVKEFCKVLEIEGFPIGCEFRWCDDV